MKLWTALLALAGTACFFCSEAQTSASGPERNEWTLKPSDKPDHVQFSIESRTGNNRWNSSSPIPWSSIHGLTREQVDKLNSAAQFEVMRDAGRLICDGTFHFGRGLGTFTFQASPGYQAELQKLGYATTGDRRPLDYFLFDVSIDFARAVREADAQATAADLIELRIHGVTRAYMSELRAAGYADLHARDYKEMKIHGVSTEFAREVRKGGYAVDSKKLVQLRIHGVDSEFMAELKRAGYDLPIDRIVELKIHGVSPEFVRDTRDLGYRFSARELTDLRIHGVDARYLRKIQSSGFQNLTASKIVQLKIHGID